MNIVDVVVCLFVCLCVFFCGGRGAGGFCWTRKAPSIQCLSYSRCKGKKYNIKILCTKLFAFPAMQLLQLLNCAIQTGLYGTVQGVKNHGFLGDYINSRPLVSNKYTMNPTCEN